MPIPPGTPLSQHLINVQTRIDQTNEVFDAADRDRLGNPHPQGQAMCEQILRNQLTIMRLILHDHGVESE
jgi:hypothetical protein